MPSSSPKSARSVTRFLHCMACNTFPQSILYMLSNCSQFNTHIAIHFINASSTKPRLKSTLFVRVAQSRKQHLVRLFTQFSS